MITKNRNRSTPTFANINLLGECNADCYFCLGKDIQNELAGKNQLNYHFSKWQNFNKFISLCKKNEIKKLYLTGQTADGLQYKYIDELLYFLQDKNSFSVGLRTNGLLAKEKINSIQKFNDEIGFSIHSLKPETNYQIMKSWIIPDWDYIIPRSGDNVRISIVLGRYNIDEFFNIIECLSRFDNVKYVQARRISTDTRQDVLMEDIEAFESFYDEFKKEYPIIKKFYGSEIHKVFDKEISFWRTVETCANSFNYFTDGTVSDEYFVVEGYLKNMV